MRHYRSFNSGHAPFRNPDMSRLNTPGCQEICMNCAAQIIPQMSIPRSAFLTFYIPRTPSWFRGNCASFESLIFREGTLRCTKTAIYRWHLRLRYHRWNLNLDTLSGEKINYDIGNKLYRYYLILHIDWYYFIIRIKKKRFFNVARVDYFLLWRKRLFLYYSREQCNKNKVRSCVKILISASWVVYENKSQYQEQGALCACGFA